MPRLPVRVERSPERALGARLRAARARAGLTRAEAARRVGLEGAEYGQLERGACPPSLPVLRRLCVVLDIDSDELLGLEVSSPDVRRLVQAVRGLSAAQVKMLHLLAESLPSASRD
ncbi:MAG: helix-turn-helix transcriptional regulator [Cystobacter sp.]